MFPYGFVSVPEGSERIGLLFNIFLNLFIFFSTGADNFAESERLHRPGS